MNIFEEMDMLIGNNSQSLSDLHCYFVGICTAHRSPGRFAVVRNKAGKDVASAEGATSEDALRNLINKLKSKPSMPAMPSAKPKMPGM